MEIREVEKPIAKLQLELTAEDIRCLLVDLSVINDPYEQTQQLKDALTELE